MRPKLILSALLVGLFSACHQPHISVNDLVCEGLTNPLGIDKISPRFGWKVASQKNGTEQRAYQILVASDPKLLRDGRADLWDSGKTVSAESVYVPYSGNKLASGVQAFWKVRVWDETGTKSDWSQPAMFGIGLLAENDWQAAYIGFPTEAGYRECPQLFQSFDIGRPDGRYLLHVNSLGYHEVYLNGSKACVGILTPAVSQFDKRSLVNTYDVTSLVQKGRNDLILWLGSGWYTEGLPGVVSNGPLVRAQLEKVKNNTRTIIAATGPNWLGRTSSYTRHGNWRPHRFGGEIFNGALSKTDLSVADSPERTWQKATVTEVPPHQVTPQMVEINLITDTIRPVAVLQLAPDTFLIDMGKNLTGWLEIHFHKLRKSQEVTIEYYDHLPEYGEFNHRNHYDRYIASGEGDEVFINKFNYHGFRYLRVINTGRIPDLDSICGYLVHTGFETASGFECADHDLNQVHDMIQYTLRCLGLGGDFVDCPHIERLGYGGDGNASTVTAQTMFDLGPLYNNWLQAWSDCVRDDGGMPHTAPNPYPAGGGPYWCGFIITASWQTFLNYGDTLVLEKNYPAMQKWLGYVNQYTVDGLLKRWPDTDYRGWYLGDWATPDGIDQTAEASVDVVNNAFVVYCLENMQKIATILNKTEDARQYAAQKTQLRQRIHEKFFNPKDNTYATGTQVDLAFPMIAGVVPPGLAKEVEKSLYRETEIVRNGHFACGLVGLPVITEWTVKNNAPGLMYSMMKKRDYPGYLYMIDNGATTTWEHWNGKRSHIHNCYNGTGSWFYHAIGGIRPLENAPGWRKVRFGPQIPDGLTWAKTFKITPYGKISAHWELTGDNLSADLQIPVGIEAEIDIPPGETRYTLNGVEKLLQGSEKGRVVLKSGQNKISYKIK